MKLEQFVVRRMYYIDFGYGKEVVQFAGESPDFPGNYGFYTADGGMHIVNKTNLEKLEVMEVFNEC